MVGIPVGRPREGFDGVIERFSNGSIGSINSLCEKDPKVLEQIGSDLVRDWQMYCEYTPVCEPIEPVLNDGYCYGVGYLVIVRGYYLYESVVNPSQKEWLYDSSGFQSFQVWGAVLDAGVSKEGEFVVFRCEAFGNYPSGRTSQPVRFERVIRLRSELFSAPFASGSRRIDYDFEDIVITPYSPLVCPPPQRCIAPPPFVPKRYTNREFLGALGRAGLEAILSRVLGRFLPAPSRLLDLRRGVPRRERSQNRNPQRPVKPRQQSRQNRDTIRRDYSKKNRQSLPKALPPKKGFAPPPKPQSSRRNRRDVDEGAKRRKRRDLPPPWKPQAAPRDRSLKPQAPPRKTLPPVRIPRPVPRPVPSPVVVPAPLPVPVSNPVSAASPFRVPVVSPVRLPGIPDIPIPVTRPLPSPGVLPVPERDLSPTPRRSPVSVPSRSPVSVPGLSVSVEPRVAPGLEPALPPIGGIGRNGVNNAGNDLPSFNFSGVDAPPLPDMSCFCPPTTPVYIERIVQVPVQGLPGRDGKDGKDGEDAKVEFEQIEVPIASCDDEQTIAVPVLKGEDGGTQAALYQALFGEIAKLRRRGQLVCQLDGIPEGSFWEEEVKFTYENPVWLSPQLPPGASGVAVSVFQESVPPGVRAYKLAGGQTEYALGNASWVANADLQILPYSQVSTLNFVMVRPEIEGKPLRVRFRLSLKPGCVAYVYVYEGTLESA